MEVVFGEDCLQEVCLDFNSGNCESFGGGCLLVVVQVRCSCADEDDRIGEFCRINGAVENVNEWDRGECSFGSDHVDEQAISFGYGCFDDVGGDGFCKERVFAVDVGIDCACDAVVIGDEVHGSNVKCRVAKFRQGFDGSMADCFSE